MVLYVALAKLGLALNPAAGHATLVWAPSGLSLAVLIVGGYHFSAAVAVGAFAANLWSGTPPVVALGIAAGNTLEALTGAFLLQKIPGFRPSLDRFADVVGLIVTALLLSTVVGATLGAIAVTLGGTVPARAVFPVWATWWAGDAIGDVLVAPVVLTWARGPRWDLRPAAILEAIALAALLLALSALIFAQPVEAVVQNPFLQPAVLFVPLVWAAMRFGVRGAATGVFLAAVPAIWGTYNGHGVFARDTRLESLAALHVVLGAASLTVLSLGAVVDGRERSRRALEDSEERHRLAIEAARLGTWCWNVREDRLHWTPRCREMHGIRPDEELSCARFLAAIHPDDRERTARAMARAVAEQKEYRIEHRVVLSGGRVRWLSVLGHTVQDEGGVATRMLGVVMDVTAAKEAEAERGELLERERAARAEAQAATLAKDDFLAVLSHELRTPLQAILGWTRMLRGRSGDACALEKGLATIERNAEAQTRLIEDLLDVSRIVSGKLRVERVPVCLVEVIEPAVESARAAAAAKSIRLDANVYVGGIEVLGDPSRLRQIVSNLLTNAVKFTPPGGRVDIHLEREGDAARIVVTDTGRGIRSEFLPHVFDRFRQQDERGPTRSEGGLGLGLAIVRHLVEAHGGTVRAESPGDGLGATFVVMLPLLS